MALVKTKPTSAGRRSMVKVVNADLHKGAPYAPLVEALHKRFVDRQFVDSLRADATQQRHRIASDLLPQLRIDGREQVLRRLVPRPAQVDRQPFHRDQAVRKMCADGKPA